MNPTQLNPKQPDPKQQDPNKQNPQPDRPADPQPDQPIALKAPGARDPGRATEIAPNEGEGNRTAARAYNKGATQFTGSGKVEAQAKAAERAVDGPEGPALRDAEAAGKSHSAGEDPALRRAAWRRDAV